MPSPTESSSTRSEVNKHVPTASSPTSPSSLQATKRKRNDHNGRESAVANPNKRRKVKKVKQDNDENLDLESGVNVAIGKLDNRLLADYVARRTKRFSPNLSLVELEDLHIPGNDSMAVSATSSKADDEY
jgi:protein CMS1